MTTSYAELLRKPTATSQRQAVPGREHEMIQNRSGGYGFIADQWQRLNRFLFTGTLGGTYYAGERDLSKENFDIIKACIAEDARRVLKTALDVSVSGDAPSNSPAITVLALVCKFAPGPSARNLAYLLMPQICRTGTHLFEFIDLMKALGKSGMGFRKSIGYWYEGQKPRDLAYQLIKYRQRNGFTHRDALRISRPHFTGELGQLAGWVVRGDGSMESEAFELIAAYEHAQREGTPEVEVVDMIKKYNLPREALPTQMLNSVAIWDALLEKMPMTAMIRNLGKLSSMGMLEGNNDRVKHIVATITDSEKLHKARVHPLAIFKALQTYSLGRGVKGNLTWSVNDRIAQGLDAAFYAAFKNIVPSSQRILVGIDVSGSMFGAGWYTHTDNGINAPIAMATATAMVYLAQNPDSDVMCFNFEAHDISMRGRSITDVTKEALKRFGGGTKGEKPFEYALKRGTKYDGFLTLSDSESWAGNRHVFQVVEDYRKRLNKDARWVNVQTTSDGAYLQEPQDKLAMEIAGFDASLVTVANKFFAGDL